MADDTAKVPPGFGHYRGWNRPPTAPFVRSFPALQDVPREGVSLTCSSGDWVGTPTITFSYQWLRGGTPISGATSNVYVPVTADVGAFLSCVVTATNSVSSSQATSQARQGLAAPPTNTSLPSLTAPPAVGVAVSCSTGSWLGTAPITYAYQWMLNGAPISGATLSSYTPAPMDVGGQLSCVVTASNVVGSTAATATSQQVSSLPVNLVAPALGATPVHGTPVSCSQGTWVGTAPITYTYQWRRDSTDIVGAVAQSYTPLQGDVGTSLSCRVTAQNPVGSASVTSSSSTVQAAVPVNTAAPALSGVPAVGVSVSCSTGSWTGSAPITYEYQWLFNGVPIGGATLSSYTPLAGHAGGLIGCRVTASNAAGSEIAFSNEGTVSGVAPTNTSVPVLTGTFVVGSEMTCPTGSWTGTAPITYSYQWLLNGTSISGATSSTYTPVVGQVGQALSCRVTATNSAGSAQATSASGTVSAAASEGNVGPFTPAPAVARTTLQLAAPAAGNRPWALAHEFKQGDLPAGQSVHNTQTVVKSAWPDGSARIAILAGVYPFAGTTATLQIGAGAQPTGTALTTASLKATGITASVTAGAFGSVNWAGTDWDTPFLAWVSGAVMSSWIYRKAIGSDAHLVAWLEIRLFSTGAVEVLPWVENGYIRVPGPTSKSATFTFTLGGTQRFSALIDLPSRTRTPLINGPELSYWLGSDPGVTARHDAAYLQATDLVPTYRATVSPTADVVTSLVSTFSPLQVGNFNATMGSAGYQRSIGLIPEWDVLYLTTTAPIAWAALQRNGYSAGRWDTHWRDENTNRPMRFSQFPNISDNSSTTGDYPPEATGTAAPHWDIPHHPSVGYMAYLVTGRWFFMEEVLFAATRNYLHQVNTIRQFSAGVFRPSSGAVTLRGTAWALRTLAQAAVVAPPEDPLHAEMVASLEANVNHNHAQYIAQVNNPYGMVETYGDNTGPSDGRWTTATWQQDFFTAAAGYMVSLQPPVSGTVRTKIAEFFQWKAKSIVGRLGGLGPTEWLYRDAAPYTIALASNDNPNWVDGTGPWPASWRAMYDLTYDGVEEANPGPIEDGPLRGGNIPSASSYWGNLQPAIAYAVQHGAAGAVTAYNRMIGASNWATFEANLNVTPVWSVKPASGLGPSVLLDALDALTAGAAFSNFSSLTNVTEITETAGPSGTARNWLETQPNAPLTNWPGKVTWMDTGNQVCLVGTAEGYVSDVPLGNHAKAVFLDADTGVFSVQWNPFGRNTGHLYDSNSSRELNGYVYKKPYNWNTIYRMNVATKVWSVYHDMVELDSTFGFGVAVAMDVFPTMGAQGSLIFVNGGKVARHDIATGQNTLLSTGLAGTLDAYNVCSYHPGIDAMVLGGGQNVASHLYKLTPAGVFTQLTNSLPAGVSGVSSAGSIGTVLLPDPFSRAYAHLIDCITTGFTYRLDLTTGAWTQTSAVPAVTVGRSHNTAVTVPGHGILLIAGRGRASDTLSLSSVWGYKPS